MPAHFAACHRVYAALVAASKVRNQVLAQLGQALRSADGDEDVVWLESLSWPRGGNRRAVAQDRDDGDARASAERTVTDRPAGQR